MTAMTVVMKAGWSMSNDAVFHANILRLFQKETVA